MGLRCWCFRIISTGLSRSSSKYAFRRTTKKNLGGISTYISTSLPSWCSFLATEPKRRKEVMPKVFCSSSAWETMRAMYSSLVYIFTILAFLMLLPLQGVKLIALIPRALPWARSFCPFRAYCCNEFLPFRVLASRRICNPAFKNVLTYLGSADL